MNVKRNKRVRKKMKCTQASQKRYKKAKAHHESANLQCKQEGQT